MIHEKYPSFTYHNDYVYGSLFGQLLQENIATSDYPGGDDINNATAKTMLLNPGQGGPYQLNDYSKRLPGVNQPGSLGMINYTVLQAALGYSIASQDSGNQTKQVGPDSLDNIYFGPIAAAYFHYNDLNRMEVNNSNPWGPQAKNWPACKANLSAGNVNFLDMILNAAYNAGTYSNILNTYTDLCANPNGQLTAFIPNMDNYLLNDPQYIADFQLPSGYASLPSWYNNTTFIIYPRQIRFYIDQLNNDNARLAKTQMGPMINSLAFSVGSLQSVFASAMETLAYVNQSQVYVHITAAQANAAFAKAMASAGVTTTDTLNFNNPQNREVMYSVLIQALVNLETDLGFKFNGTTETDHKLGQ